MGILDGAPYVVNAAIVQSIQGAQGGSSLHVPPRQCAGTDMLHDSNPDTGWNESCIIFNRLLLHTAGFYTR